MKIINKNQKKKMMKIWKNTRMIKTFKKLKNSYLS